MLASFKKKGIPYLETLPEKSLMNLVEKADQAYFHSPDPLLTDEEYDHVRNYVQTQYPHLSSKVGAVPPSHNKHPLPFYMGSLDKVKQAKDIHAWTVKIPGPYCLTPKLDGISALWCKGRLYTRGNGIYGQDISSLCTFLHLPILPDGMTLRGELIMKKSTCALRFGKEACPRSIVSGIVNRKTCDPEDAKCVDFLVYEIVEPKMKPSDQFQKLQELRVPTIEKTIQATLDPEMLSNTLKALRESYLYDVDGIVITQDCTHPTVQKGNPLFAVAYKTLLEDQVRRAVVEQVQWNISKDGLLKPKLRVQPVMIRNTKIEFVTAFNAHFVEKNRLGPGSVIELSRSGDVIPHIVQVLQGAPVPQMPDIPYYWNEKRTEVMVENFQDHPDVCLKVMTKFFQDLGCRGLGPAQLEKMMKNGIDTLPKILRMKKEDFRSIYSEKMSEKLWSSLQDSLQNAKLDTLMAASNQFGRGISIKSIQLILTHCPAVLTTIDAQDTYKTILSNVKGLGQKTIEGFFQGIPNFLRFLQESGLTLETFGP